MAEEYRVFYQRMGDLKKKYKGVSDELLRQVFVDGFRSGRKIGYNAGYSKAVEDEVQFTYSDDEPLEPLIDDSDYSFDDEMDEMSYERFDPADEMLDS